MRTSVLYTVLGVALVVGFACKGPDTLTLDQTHFRGLARGANVVPGTGFTSSDTLAEGIVALTIDTAANTITWGATVTTPPVGTLDSIALYQVAAGTALPAAATAVLCAGAAACTTLSGSATIIGAATAKTIWSSARAFGTQVVFFTTTYQKAAGGAMRGTVYVNPL